MRAVVDTGVLVSALIRRQGTTGDVLRALRDGRFTVIYSTDTLVEVINVLGRAPFRTKYHIEPDDITALINLIRLRGELVTPRRKVTVCRKHKDDKFLELAVSGAADYIITGDKDLLQLRAFRGVPIVTADGFLRRQS